MNKGTWITSGYRRGDLPIFDFGKGIAHIGIITGDNTNGSYETTEGNTSVYSYDNGGAVMKRTRYDYQIVGACRPAYPSTASWRISSRSWRPKLMLKSQSIRPAVTRSNTTLGTMGGRYPASSILGVLRLLIGASTQPDTSYYLWAAERRPAAQRWPRTTGTEKHQQQEATDP